MKEEGQKKKKENQLASEQRCIALRKSLAALAGLEWDLARTLQKGGKRAKDT